MGNVQSVQIAHHCVHLRIQRAALIALDLVRKEVPLEALLLAPLRKLRHILSHEEKLLAGMAGHVAVSNAKVSELLLVGAGHLSEHRALAVHHLVMRKHEDEILTVCINHGERKRPVATAAEQRILPHVGRKVVHPAHIPLEIKAETVVV